MKTRNGFVSNSSSSSFIVGIGKVVDQNRLHKFMTSNKIKFDKYNFYTVKVSDLDDKKNCYSIRTNGDSIVVESFQNNAMIKKDGLNPDDTLVVANIINNEGDTGVFEYDESNWGGINYDIDLDHFSEEQQTIYTLFFNDNSGIDSKTSDASFGAARNG